MKFSHTRYRALGLELIPVYRQSARRWHEVNHAIDLAVGCHYFLPGLWLPPSFHQMALPVNGSTHLIPAYYSFIYPERMKGWVGLVGWPVSDGLPTLVKPWSSKYSWKVYYVPLISVSPYSTSCLILLNFNWYQDVYFNIIPPLSWLPVLPRLHLFTIL